MNTALQPILELTIIIPGMFLAYLPVKSYIHAAVINLFQMPGQIMQIHHF